MVDYLDSTFHMMAQYQRMRGGELRWKEWQMAKQKIKNPRNKNCMDDTSAGDIWFWKKTKHSSNSSSSVDLA